jgi:sporulation protein YlmC with PRC-barrel domain
MEHLDNATGINRSGRFANRPVKHLTASSILGDKIYNSGGEHLGEIKDIMLNLDDGSVAYIVVEVGGFLGMGQKLFSVPFKELHLDAEKQTFILNRSKESLENEPGFDKDHWPETNSHQKNGSWRSAGGFMGSSTGSEY